MHVPFSVFDHCRFNPPVLHLGIVTLLTTTNRPDAQQAVLLDSNLLALVLKMVLKMQYTMLAIVSRSCSDLPAATSAID